MISEAGLRWLLHLHNAELSSLNRLVNFLLDHVDLASVVLDLQIAPFDLRLHKAMIKSE